MSKRKSQVWVETAIYILISLTIISIILSMAVPLVEKIKDRNIIEQTIISLNVLNNKILETEENEGSIRIVLFKISKGKLIIDSEKNQVQYILENTRLELSEPGQKIKEGEIVLETQNYGKRFNILLAVNYTDKIEITSNKEEKNRILQAGTAPYKIQMENLGFEESSGKTNMDFNVI